MRRLARELESRLAATARERHAPAKATGQNAEETAFDVASQAGHIGFVKGAPTLPTDRSMNPEHTEGFGRD